MLTSHVRILLNLFDFLSFSSPHLFLFSWPHRLWYCLCCKWCRIEELWHIACNSGSVSAHDGKAKERAADYQKINAGLNLPKNTGTKKGSPAKKKNRKWQHTMLWNVLLSSVLSLSTCFLVWLSHQLMTVEWRRGLTLCSGPETWISDWRKNATGWTEQSKESKHKKRRTLGTSSCTTNCSEFAMKVTKTCTDRELWASLLAFNSRVYAFWFCFIRIACEINSAWAFLAYKHAMNCTNAFFQQSEVPCVLLGC